MSTATLTGQERVNRAMNHQDHDRIPRTDSFWAQTIEKWISEGHIKDREDVHAKLGSDFGYLCWSWPAPFPGRHEVIEEDDDTQVITDKWGQTARHWKKRAGTPDHVGWECTDSKVWFDTFKPAMLATGLHIDVEEVKRNFAKARENGKWSFLAGAESFEMTRKMMGDEVTMIAMAAEPEWVRDVSQVHTDLLIRDYQAIIDAGVQPDGIWMYGDMAYNHATMCSPAMYRELIWPDHKRLADFAHDNGMKFIYHTDGDVNGVMDLYLEAGFDSLQPLEAKANMDVRKLCPKYGDRMCFFGNIDIMVMATNDLEKVEHEVVSKIEAGKKTKAYIYHSDHSVPVSVEWSTYEFVIDLVHKHGNY